MMKFILFRNSNSEELTPVVFLALIKHSDMATVWIGEHYLEPIETGFVHVNDNGKMVPYGESISLDLKSTDMLLAFVDKIMGPQPTPKQWKNLRIEAAQLRGAIDATRKKEQA